jgi:hypothetical protein
MDVAARDEQGMSGGGEGGREGGIIIGRRTP